jgi:hypothetical protein
MLTLELGAAQDGNEATMVCPPLLTVSHELYFVHGV